MLAAAFTAIALVISPTSSTAERERDFIYCTGFDASSNHQYYSAVFAGDYLQNQQHAQRFTAHLRGRYGADLPTSFCFYEERRGDAQAARDNAAALKRTEGKRVIYTDWVG